jgi:hypothetical protein
MNEITPQFFLAKIAEELTQEVTVSSFARPSWSLQPWLNETVILVSPLTLRLSPAACTITKKKIISPPRQFVKHLVCINITMNQQEAHQ